MLYNYTSLRPFPPPSLPPSLPSPPLPQRGAMSNQSKEEYREAAHRLYMEQERQKTKLRKFRSSSPPLTNPPSTAPHTTQSPTHFGTLPKRCGRETS